MFKIIPSILVRDLKSFQDKLALLEGNCQSVHIDIMDGRFVPNISISVDEIGGYPTKLQRIAHLMTYDPDNYFSQLSAYGFFGVCFHFEAVDERQIPRIIHKAKEYHLRVSLVLNPQTMEDKIKDYTSSIDELICMTVNPGFGGQEYNKSVVGKVARIHRLYPDLEIAVDGGINETNIEEFFSAGAHNFIMGSAIFRTKPKLSINYFGKILSQLDQSKI